MSTFSLFSGLIGNPKLFPLATCQDMLNKVYQTTIGGDPELILVDLYTGKLVDLHSLNIKGTKEEPFKDTSVSAIFPGKHLSFFDDDLNYSERRKSKSLLDGYVLHPVYQLDNAAFEVNLPVVYLTSRLNLGGYASFCSHTLDKVAGGGHHIARFATYMLNPDMMNNHKVMMFGCAPDYCAYEEGRANPTPDPYSAGLLRFTGGHITIGYRHLLDESWDNLFIKLVDFGYLEALSSICGLHRWSDPKLLYKSEHVTNTIQHALDLEIITKEEVADISCIPEKEPKPATVNLLLLEHIRRKFYGKAGSYRKTPFGVEYRVASGQAYTDAMDMHGWHPLSTVTCIVSVLAAAQELGMTADDVEQAINTTTDKDLFSELRDNINDFRYLKSRAFVQSVHEKVGEQRYSSPGPGTSPSIGELGLNLWHPTPLPEGPLTDEDQEEVDDQEDLYEGN